MYLGKHVWGGLHLEGGLAEAAPRRSRSKLRTLKTEDHSGNRLIHCTTGGIGREAGKQGLGSVCIDSLESGQDTFDGGNVDLLNKRVAPPNDATGGEKLF
jgi:hypothetical protein